ncbi:MAG: hypothetical protein LBM99_01965, partial [Bacillales bacterium]|nr:hypothetical protein [Bacillales bacterium]
MALVAAICTQCGAKVEVDNNREAGICKHCGSAFIVEKAVNIYNNNNTNITNITAEKVVVSDKRNYNREAKRLLQEIRKLIPSSWGGVRSFLNKNDDRLNEYFDKLDSFIKLRDSLVNVHDDATETVLADKLDIIQLNEFKDYFFKKIDYLPKKYNEAVAELFLSIRNIILETFKDIGDTIEYFHYYDERMRECTSIDFDYGTYHFGVVFTNDEPVLDIRKNGREIKPGKSEKNTINKIAKIIKDIDLKLRSFFGSGKLYKINLKNINKENFLLENFEVKEDKAKDKEIFLSIKSIILETYKNIIGTIKFGSSYIHVSFEDGSSISRRGNGIYFEVQNIFKSKISIDLAYGTIYKNGRGIIATVTERIAIKK